MKSLQIRSFHLTLPATSANLGPAFDAAALALSLRLEIRAEVAHEFSVTASGRDVEICGNPENHLILTTYKEILKSERKPVQPVVLKIKNEIPIGKGCGSSAAARLAGIAMAVYFGELNYNDSRIIAECSVREHHPDNAAACWMGGLAIARTCGERNAVVSRVVPAGKWPLVLAVPPEPLPTQEARRVLPATYSRADAVSNVQNSMLLLAAFVQGRHDLLRTALEDRFHQPYRARLCPLLPALWDVAGNEGIAGVALSGAGPSVLVFLKPKSAPERIKRQISLFLHKQGLSAELISAEIAAKGAREDSGWNRRKR